MESIPLGGGYIPSYPGTYPGMEHPRRLCTRLVCACASVRVLFVGLYTILPSPILHVYGIRGGGVGGGSYIAQWSCNSIAIG